MCHGAFNHLSEVQMLRPFLYSWRADNLWLHAIGGWTIGARTLVHVYSRCSCRQCSMASRTLWSLDTSTFLFRCGNERSRIRVPPAHVAFGCASPRRGCAGVLRAQPVAARSNHFCARLDTHLLFHALVTYYRSLVCCLASKWVCIHGSVDVILSAAQNTDGNANILQ